MNESNVQVKMRITLNFIFLYMLGCYHANHENARIFMICDVKIFLYLQQFLFFSSFLKQSTNSPNIISRNNNICRICTLFSLHDQNEFHYIKKTTCFTLHNNFA